MVSRRCTRLVKNTTHPVFSCWCVPALTWLCLGRLDSARPRLRKGVLRYCSRHRKWLFLSFTTGCALHRQWRTTALLPLPCCSAPTCRLRVSCHLHQLFILVHFQPRVKAQPTRFLAQLAPVLLWPACCCIQQPIVDRHALENQPRTVRFCSL